MKVLKENSKICPETLQVILGVHCLSGYIIYYSNLFSNKP